MTPNAAASPLVSVVIPVFNSVSYLGETLDSMLEQGLSQEELEVVTVDDGSDDGSEKVLDDYARRYPNFRVIHQAPSGGPASPCNVGVYAARGKYFFVLGSDDVLTPNAMRDLVGIAEREGSDIVLGKLGSIGGRRTPGAVFAKTVYDADLVENHAFNTLSAVKLFRAELLHKTGALHPTSLRIGSDQPFVAALYLAAKKVSICADRDFVLIRTREDGTNITSTRRTPRDYMDLLTLLVPVITDGTDLGEFRDGLLRRPFRNTLTKSVKPGFLALDGEIQRHIVDELRDTIAPLYNEATAAHLDALPRTKVELALDGEVETLREVMAWEKACGKLCVEHDGSQFRYRFPDDLADRVGSRRMHAPAVAADVTLTGVRTAEGIELRARALTAGCATAADSVVLRLRSRGTEAVIDIATAIDRPVELASGRGHDIHVTVDTGALPAGVWDAYIVQIFGEDEVETRLGAKRDASLDSSPSYLHAETETGAVGVLYYTRGAGNLSLDIGFSLHSRNLLSVSVLGTIQQEDGTKQALIDVVSNSDVEFRVSVEQVSGAGSVPIPYVQASRHLYCLALPGGERLGRERRVTVVSGDESWSITLPHAVERPEPARPEDFAAWRTEASTREILRRATRDLRIVGGRCVRRAGRDVKSMLIHLRARRRG
ncbi:glycosyltransferase family 2 protein [Brachybacterium alimentarium]|uniref:glycosyltransferase family 2 protein n=1 Tax=Brachybacterium alimentarium TaxID=47845 RepID=UPI0015F0B0C3|nr:glycosyltransferase family 2 protein [Brachybacterium alimentarium]